MPNKAVPLIYNGISNQPGNLGQLTYDGNLILTLNIGNEETFNEISQIDPEKGLWTVSIGTGNQKIVKITRKDNRIIQYQLASKFSITAPVGSIIMLRFYGKLTFVAKNMKIIIAVSAVVSVVMLIIIGIAIFLFIRSRRRVSG